MATVIGGMTGTDMGIEVAEEEAAALVTVSIVESMGIWQGTATTVVVVVVAAVVAVAALVAVVRAVITAEDMGIWREIVPVDPVAAEAAVVGLVIPVGNLDTWRETVWLVAAGAAAVTKVEGLAVAVVESVTTVGSLDTLPGTVQRLAHDFMT